MKLKSKASEGDYTPPELQLKAEVKFAQEYPRVSKVRRVIARLFNF